MTKNLRVAIARDAIDRMRVQGLKGAKADKAMMEFIHGGLAVAMAVHGDESAEARDLSTMATNFGRKGAAYLQDIITQAEAAPSQDAGGDDASQDAAPRVGNRRAA